jgi:activator of 2-hydroxyglutaryl-CoA dehydratase
MESPLKDVAKNACLKCLLVDTLERKIKVPEDPQMVGTFGAARIVQDDDRLIDKKN